MINRWWKKQRNLSSTQIYLIIADNPLSTIDHENVPRNETKAKTKTKGKFNDNYVSIAIWSNIYKRRKKYERKTNNKITKFRDENMYLNIVSNKSKILCIKKKSQCLSMPVFFKSFQWLLFRWTVDWSFLLSFCFEFISMKHRFCIQVINIPHKIFEWQSNAGTTDSWSNNATISDHLHEKETTRHNQRHFAFTELHIEFEKEKYQFSVAH